MKPVNTRCTVCLHPEVDTINSRIIAGVSCRSIGSEFNLGYRSVANHGKRHLPQQMVKASALQEQESADRLLEQVNMLYDKALLLIEKSDSDKKWQASATAIKEARNCLELTGKLIGTLKTGTSINIVYNTEFIAAKVAIYEALKPYPDAREAVIVALESEDVYDAEYKSIDSPNA